MLVDVDDLWFGAGSGPTRFYSSTVFIFLIILIYVAFDNDMHTSNLFKQNRNVEEGSADFLSHTLLIVYLSGIDAHMLDTWL